MMTVELWNVWTVWGWTVGDSPTLPSSAQMIHTLSLPLSAQKMQAFLEEWETKLGIKITASQVCGRVGDQHEHRLVINKSLLLVQETEPMGTAGPLAVARQILDDGSGEPFFVLNSDVICEFPLQDLLDKHKASGAEATIFVTKVRVLHHNYTQTK